MIHGFRNRDLQETLLGKVSQDKDERRRQAAAIGRQFRTLRAHGLIRKLSGTPDAGRLALALEMRLGVSVPSRNLMELPNREITPARLRNAAID